MKRTFIVAATSFATFAYGLTATAAEPLVRFEGGIGVDPVANTGVTNTVKGVPPGGVPWAIQKLKVNIKDDGQFCGFWRRFGRSNKDAAQGGRWGLGKLVFPLASSIRMLIGLLRFGLLPVREYPNVDSPTVSVQTTYPGASAEVVETKITEPLEKEISSIEGITLYMQPVQDLSVEDRVSRTQYQYSVEDADSQELATWAPKLVACNWRLTLASTAMPVATSSLLDGRS